MEPKVVRVSPEGVYIKIHSFFVHESGVFVASGDAKVEIGSGRDPSWKRIQGRVYWYKIKG